MQPTQPLSSDIKTLADWLYERWSATDPIIVKNILDTPYSFRYCASEEIETPEQNVRRVMKREYAEITFEPGEEKVILGAQAYLFVDGIARTYAFKRETDPEIAANATADLSKLVECAQLAIIGKTGYNNQVTPVGIVDTVRAPEPIVPPHNPNIIPTGEQTEQNTSDPTPFGDLNSQPQDVYTTLPAISANKAKELGKQPRDAVFLKNGEEITFEEYDKAVNGKATANA